MHQVNLNRRGGDNATRMREQRLLEEERRRVEETYSKEERAKKEKLMKEQRDAMDSINQMS